jgi:hypothetical protein
MANSEHFYVSAKVKYKKNPNPVEVIYVINDINVYVRDGVVSVQCELQPDKDYPIPDSRGFISCTNTTEVNVLDLDFVE